MSPVLAHEEPIDQQALYEIAHKQGIPDTPEDERTFQDDRKQKVMFFFGALLFLSIAVELHNRGMDLSDFLRNLINGLVAVVDPSTALPSFDGGSLAGGALAIGRNMLPALFMAWLVLLFGVQFVKAVYGLSSTKQARDHLMTGIFGEFSGGDSAVRGLPTTWVVNELAGEIFMRGPFVIVRDGKVVAGGGNDPVARIGGPGLLVVYTDSAVLLERAGQLTRVVGPGVAPLRRFEKVRDVIDLRPRKYATYKEHKTFNVGGMSREGIPIEWPVDVEYQINDQGWGFRPATDGTPYPFSEEAVLTAFTDHWLRGGDGDDHLDWGDRIVVGDAEGGLRSIMARYPLDRLIQPLYELGQLIDNYLEESELRTLCGDLNTDYDVLPGQGKAEKARELVRFLERRNQVPDLVDILERDHPGVPWELSFSPRRQIEEQLANSLRNGAVRHGAKILAVNLGNVRLKDQVTNQWIKTWQARWQKLAREELAVGEAERVFQVNRVKAVAQEMLLAIQEGLERPEAEPRSLSEDILTLRLVETLRNVAAHPRAFPSIADPQKAAAMWRVINTLVTPTTDLLTSGDTRPERGN